MKKNININLSGQLYAIDEDAYQTLKSYLDSMESYFLRQEGGDEIAEDIKNRVSELLWERKENGQQAVDIETVKAIIKQIGNPSEIDDTNYGHEPEEQGEANAPTREKEKRHFYRDKQDKILGGICAGLAHYFGGQDPLLYRIGVLVLAFLSQGIIPFIYVVVWILAPQAITPEDRLRMKGLEVNGTNLSEQILTDSQTAPTKNKLSHKIFRVIMWILLVTFICTTTLIFINFIPGLRFM